MFVEILVVEVHHLEIVIGAAPGRLRAASSRDRGARELRKNALQTLTFEP